MKNIVVQKYGGTSVSSESNREFCIEKVNQELSKNNKVVVVVSAMGRNGDAYSTDTLLSLVSNIEGKVKDFFGIH